MSDKNKNIDDFFRDKLKNKELDYKSEYWNKMESVLDNTPSGFMSTPGSNILGLNKFVFWGIVSLISVSSFFAIYFGTVNKSGEEPKVQQTDIEERIFDTEEETNVDTKEEIASVEETTEALIEIVNEETIVEEAVINRSSNKNTSDEQDKHKIATQNLVEENVKDEKVPIKEEMSITKEEAIVPERIEEIVKSEKIIEEEDKIENKISISDDPVIIKDTVESNPDKQFVETIDTFESTKTSEIDTTITEESELTEEESQSESTDEEISKRINKFIESNNLYLKIGGNCFKGFSNDISGESKWGINPLFGLGYEYLLNDKFSLSLDIYYIRRGGNSLSQSSVKTTYFLFKETDSTCLNTNTLTFLDIPVQVKYKLFPKHYLLAGFYNSFLLNTRSDRSNIISNPFFYISEKEEADGYFSGFNNYNYGIILGYEYQVIRKGMLGLEFIRTINDLTDNEIFGVGDKDYITELQLYIRWMLF